MKSLRTNILMLFCCFSVTTAFSQKTDTAKPHYFAALPAYIPVSQDVFTQSLSATAGDKTQLTFSSDFTFNGTVISNEQKYSNLQTVIIRSNQYGNALFQVSMITNSNKEVSYVGRLMPTAGADGFEIKKDQNNQYHLQKFETAKILQDCSY